MGFILSYRHLWLQNFVDGMSLPSVKKEKKMVPRNTTYDGNKYG